MKKKIAIVTDTGFQKKEFERFFINNLCKEFDIFVFDFTKVTNPSLYKIVKKNQIKLRNFYKVNNFKNFENFFLNKKFFTTILNINNYELVVKINNFFKKNSVSVTLIQNHFVMPFKKTLFQKISSSIYTLLDKKRILLKIRYLSYKKKNTFHVTNAFVCGRKALNHSAIGRETKIIRSHSNEYDIHLRSKFNKQLVNIRKNDYAVFLDQYLPFHTDAKIFKKLNSKVSEEKYFPALNNFFSLFEKNTKKKIIIAAHPKSYYSNKDKNFWYGRSFYKNKTYELIRNSSYVLAHTSTAISYAVILKKPIIFLTSNEYIKSYDNFRVHGYADYFKQPLINIDELKEFKFNSKLTKIQKKVYKKYFDDYIKFPKSSMIELNKIFINHFKN